MALIKCPECGKEISDCAQNCPHCGYPINSNPTTSTQTDKAQEIEKYLGLALQGIQGENSEQVEKYCQKVLEINPENAKAWELEARGILFKSTLRDNNIIQAISAAANAVKYNTENKKDLALSLYSSITTHINGLLTIALTQMPTLHAPQYVKQCMEYYGQLLAGIPNLPKEKIESELSMFEQMDEDSKKAIMPKKRLIYAAHVGKPSWAEQYRVLLKQKGIL